MIDDGQSIRFAACPEDLELNAPWNDSRVVYWQHASDPIVWWSFDLLLNKPEAPMARCRARGLYEESVNAQPRRRVVFLI